MKIKCLKHAFSMHGLPVILITMLITLLGLGFLYLESTTGWVLIMTSVGVLSIFSLIGAKDGCLMRLSHSARNNS
ncbi:MAG: hypothetical protein P8Y20_02235 [Gammaproteobacteria bacterium]|jgi:uncharacterized membrane protein